MSRKIVVLASIAVLFSSSFAQPPGIDWIRMYDIGQVEEFRDIYAVAGGGYAICGIASVDINQYPGGTMYFWLSRVDDDGNQIWSGTYGIDDIVNIGESLIETDDGGFLVGGRNHSNNRINVSALLTDADGEQVWYRTYGSGLCKAVIELKAGEFALSGGTYGVGGLVMCINGAGDVLWETQIDPQVERLGHNYFYALRETQGGIVLAGTIHNLIIGVQDILWIAKVDFNGELLWQRQYGNIENHQYWYTMVSAHDDGFIIGGSVGGTQEDDRFVTDFLLSKVDDDGEIQWHRRFHFDGGDNFQSDNQRCRNIVKYEDEGYALVGDIYRRSLYIPAVIQVNNNGVELWREIYDFSRDEDFGNWNNLYGGVRGHDNSIIACGMINHLPSNPPYNGFIMKLGPYIRAPQFIYYFPEDTILTVLQGDTVDFLVRAIDYQDDELSYLWIMGDDTLSTDTTVTVIFNELGDFEVQCQVTDREFTVAITWHVSVVQFYIESFTPDTLEITLRRNSSVDFALEVRALEDAEFNYLWTLYGRGQQRQVGEEESASVLFDLTGDHRLEGLVYLDDVAEVVDWAIHVRSVIWYWWPEENELSIPVDSRQEFAVFPFNPDSDSLSYLWFLNDEQLEFDITESVISVDFSDVWNHRLVSIVHDGSEVDTVTWEIDVYDPNRVDFDNFDPLPETVALFDPRPNPFNATTTISYQLPEASEVSIKVYDIRGGLVTTLVDGSVDAGNYNVVWDGSGVPSGIYLCQMRVPGYSRSVKMVLIK